MSRAEVRGFGAWYDEKQGDTGDLWHRSLIDPPLLSRLRTLPRGTRLLDVGCGNGYLARFAARRGAKVVGVDRSRELVARARAREADEPLGITYVVADASRLRGWRVPPFDVAMAHMSLIDIRDAAGAIRSISDRLADGGRLFFTISHPCFDVDTRSGWIVDHSGGRWTVYRKVTGYRRPHSDTYPWGLPDGRVARTTGFHRPLTWYMRELRENGFVIVDLEEPSPGAEYRSHNSPREWIEEIPLHLFVEARRERRDHPRGRLARHSVRGKGRPALLPTGGQRDRRGTRGFRERTGRTPTPRRRRARASPRTSSD